ncbi:vitellogenin-like isoform X2 [Ptychodera flava]|uniref:vitellogenin-like isoform X2 n=1 Tax=Ptychodera flava TaxID=63121 RepID=UPI00396A1049
MKVFFLTIIFAVVSGANNDRTVTTRYISGQSFLYSYTGTVKSGLPNTGKEYTGLKIVCKPQITFINDETAFLKLLTPKLYEYNKTIDVEKDEALTESSLSSKFAEELQNVIKFDYVYGKVVSVYAPKDEPEWILNIKKGILSLLNLELVNDDGITTFTTFETGVVGECETLYDIVKSTGMDANTMKITKVKNMSKCVRKPVMLTSLIKTNPCDTCEGDEDRLLRSGVVYHYVATGTRLSFLIKSVFAEGQHVFTPITENGGSAVTITKQNMTLISTMAEAHDIDIPAVEYRGDLMLTFPKDEKTLTVQHSPKKKVKYLLEILVNSDIEASSDSSSHFIVLVKTLRKCNHFMIVEILEEVTTDDKKKEWLLEGIKMTGNEESVLLIKKLIDEDQITESEITELLSGLISVQKPTEMMLDVLMGICCHDVMLPSSKHYDAVDSDDFQKIIEMRRGCMLAFSALVGKFCQKAEFCPVRYEQYLENCEDMYRPLQIIADSKDTMKEGMYHLKAGRHHKHRVDPEVILRNHRTEETKVMCIKAMGNAGLKSHLDAIIRNLQNSVDNSLEVRIHAVDALGKIAPKLSNKVLSTLMPIYHNPLEDPELRIAAYLTILKTKPTQSIYILLAENLKKETSRQVGSFVFSHLMYLSNTSSPIMKKEAHSARLALQYAHPFVTPFITSLHTSTGFHKSLHLNDLKMGGFIDVYKIFTHDSILPRSVKTKMNIQLLGQNFDVFEVGIRAEGLQTVIERFFGPKGFWSRRQSIFDFVKRPRRDASNSVCREVEAIRQKFETQHHHPSELKGSLYLKLFDDEVMYKTFSEDDVKVLVSEGKHRPSNNNFEEMLKSGHQVNFKKAMVPLDVEYQEATMLGLPLAINVSAGLIMKLNFHGKLEVSPSLLHRKPTEITIDGDIRSRMEMTVIGKVGVSSPLINTGVVINATSYLNAPIKASLQSDLNGKKHKVQVYLQEEAKRELFTFNHSLYTFMDKVDDPKESFTKMSGHLNKIDKKNTSCVTLLENSLSICVDYDVILRKTGQAFYPFTGPSYFNMYSLKGYDIAKMLQFVVDLSKEKANPFIKEYELTMTTVGSPKEETYILNLIMSTHREDRKIVLKTLRSGDPYYENTLTLRMTKPMEEILFDWKFGKPKSVVQPISSHKELTSDREYRMLTTIRLPGTDRTGLHLTTVYTELPETVKTVFKKLEIMLPKYLYKMLSHVTFEPKFNQKHHTVEMTCDLISPDNAKIVLETPHQEITISNITLPVPVKSLLLRYDDIPDTLDEISELVFRKMILPTCMVYNTNIFKTFDDVTFKYEMPGTCPHVLLKDCSPKERFIVLLQNNAVILPQTLGGPERRVKVIAYVEEYKIEMYTTAWDTLEVKLNGVILDLHANKSTVTVRNLGKFMGSDREVSLYTDIGLDVFYSQDHVHAQVSGWYYNKICGMCGDYNGEIFEELKTWQGRSVSDKSLLALSWLIEGTDCQDENCKLKKIKAHQIEEIELIDGKLMSCVSLDPLFMCVSGCRPKPLTETTLTKIGFQCHHFKDRETVSLDRFDFISNRVDMEKEVAVPHECICEPYCTSKSGEY